MIVEMTRLVPWPTRVRLLIETVEDEEPVVIEWGMASYLGWEPLHDSGTGLVGLNRTVEMVAYLDFHYMNSSAVHSC